MCRDIKENLRLWIILGSLFLASSLTIGSMINSLNKETTNQKETNYQPVEPIQTGKSIKVASKDPKWGYVLGVTVTCFGFVAYFSAHEY